MEHLCGVNWYTAEMQTPYVVKASVSVEDGYHMIVTDMQNSWYCNGDVEKIKAEKKVSVL